MISIMANVAVSGASVKSKRKQLLESLVLTIDADAWFWSIVGPAEAGKMPSFTAMLRGGFSDEQFSDYMVAQEHPDMARYNAPLLEAVQQNKGLTTRLRQQLDPDNTFVKSDVYPLWKKANLAPVLLSAKPGESGSLNILCFYRYFDRELFSERDSRITHILLSRVPWLFDENYVNRDQLMKGLSQLSPRLNTVTNLLIIGRSRKDIANELNLSIHTLNDYAKKIYQLFDVHSQGELIRRFTDGDLN